LFCFTVVIRLGLFSRFVGNGEELHLTHFDLDPTSGSTILIPGMALQRSVDTSF
jgi:hypothetical protein